MAENDKILTLFSTRVRQLILQYSELKKEAQKLQSTVAAHEKEIERLQSSLLQTQRDYQSLKTAKMMEISDGDIEESKRRIASLIREVNKCITLLSGKET